MGRASAARGRGAASAPLTFAGIARLELDELLDQLIDRAQEVKATQGRLRALLGANHHVVHGLDIGELLRRIVEAARSLVGARFAIIGVLTDGHLDRVIQTPDDQPLVDLITTLPRDKGVLGYAVDDPRTLRLDDLASHPHARPEVATQNPPMRSFLRAPLRVGENSYGNLYLADYDAGIFTADDEELVGALAATAGVALENAALLNEARRRERWQAAAAELSNRLLTADTDLTQAWRDLLELALDVADADGASISIVDPVDAGQLHIVAAVGGLSHWEGLEAPAMGSVTQVALDADEAVAITDAAADLRTSGVVLRAPEVRSVLAAPLALQQDEGQPRAVLTLTRCRRTGLFDPLDARIATGFANQAATALRLSQSRHDRDKLKQLEDREGLVAELNDAILSGMMRISLALTSVASRADPDLRRLVMEQVDALDTLSRHVRDTVFNLPGA